jgi:uncharacterized protein (DUF608 family)
VHAYGCLHLAQLRVMERMARYAGDSAYAAQCEEWFAQGSRAMEDKLWNGSYYLNFYEEETGKKSDDVMGYRLDGQWAAQFHGLSPVFAKRSGANGIENQKPSRSVISP